ncbi:MAG: restriction endonuclease subunit S [Hydrogenophaga sp.]|jgi:type I restriction enzyme S subunit|nr:restriction endonuclease subunit S [Hydrogenophaga sp.]
MTTDQRATPANGVERDVVSTREQWRDVAFGDLLKEPVRNGLYKPKPFHGQGVKIVNMGELFSHPRIKDVEMKRLQLTDSERKRALISEGDLLFARRSLTAEGAGKCSIVKEISEETTFESSIIRAKPNPKEADSDFLYYYFRAPYGRYLLGTILRQVAVAGITGADLTSLVLNVPEVEAQRAIARVLCCLDDKVELLCRQNHNLEVMAEMLFRQWFLEEPAPSWVERPLSSIATFLNGLACQKHPPANEADKLPVLKIRELSSGITESSDWASSQVKPEFIVEAGDVIFAWSASLMVKVWDGERCVLNQHLFKVTSDEFPKWFYLRWCKHHLAEFIAISASHATTMGHIKRGDLDAAVVLVPTPDELRAMTQQMAPLLDKQIEIARQRRTLESLRDTLLPKLMSGEVRVAF